MKPQKQTETHGSKRPFWFYLVLILIPLLFFLLLEATLRIFSYGIDNRQWIPASGGKLILNPEISRRYFFSSGSLPYSIQDVFDEVKKPNTFRVFVLGESSAAGYPYLPIGSFSRYLKKRLELFYPELNVEVVNISMTAINSYTLADLFPGVIDQKPDVVLIYTGHNEYYGALGAGSIESFGSSRGLIKLVLKLNRLKTVELLRNVINSVSAVFVGAKESGKDGTLMSRIARDKYIPLNSEMYNKGIEQFRENIMEIFTLAQENNIKVICGSLTCNYKDQYPFVSVNDNYPRADSVFKMADKKYFNNEFHDADSMYRYAKELDVLRFRAPEAINGTLKELCREYNYPLINIDSAFAAASKNGITGNDLMTDHLHPNLKGYFLMGNIFYKGILNNGLLPEKNLPGDEYQDSLTRARFNFSELDSVIADYRIKVLKNDWPYRTSGIPLTYTELLSPQNAIDSIAFNVAEGTYTWEKAQREAAEFYLRTGNKESFIQQMGVLISQYPIITEFYELAASGLLKFQDFGSAFLYLDKAYRLKPTAFSSKWLGTIYLSRNNTDKAIYYLEESLKQNPQDAQVHYNITGAFIKKQDYRQALQHIDECLKINPRFPSAAVLKAQLLKFTR